MDATLSRFASQSRQPPETGRTLLARKWLALQLCGGVHALYAQVGDDYALMRHRVRGDEAHSIVSGPWPRDDLAAFVDICAVGLAEAGPVEAAHGQPALQAFCERVWPTPVEQEVWEPYHNERADHWRKRAYFLATQRAGPLYAETVAAIYDAGHPPEECKRRTHRDAASDLYTRIMAHKPELDPLATAAVLRDLNLGNDKVEAPAAEEDFIKDPMTDDGAVDGLAGPAHVDVVFAVADSPAVAAPLQRTQAMQAYAQEALISATFCNAKLAKQMLLLQLGQSLDAERDFSMIARNQLVGGVVLPSALEQEPLAALAGGVDDLPALDKGSEAVQALYALCEPAPPTVAAFLRKAIDVYGTGPADAEAADDLWKRQHLKRFPQLDASVVACIKAL